jgi:chemotaxis protein CheD
LPSPSVAPRPAVARAADRSTFAEPSVNEIRVKVADFAVAQGDTTLVTIGLGSCVAILLHDAQCAVGGLAHILLPSEGMSRDASNRAKFPGSAVPLLLEEMRALGSRGPVTAKIVGGASMFASMFEKGGMNVGERNVAAVRDVLARAGIPIVAEDVGGEHGRSVYFTVGDGKVEVRSLKTGNRVL